jgi:phage-related protein
MTIATSPSIKPVVWIGSTRADLASFPEEVKDAIGYALYIAQRGEKHANAKPLHGFGGAGILEIVEDHAGDTYRAVYTVRLAGRIYALHAFQKKSRAGIRTPKPEIDLIKSRLKRADEVHARWLETRREQQSDDQKNRS